MDRRTFISWVGLGCLASSLPVAIAACSSDDSSTRSESPSPAPDASPAADAPAARPDGFIEVGTLTALKADGSILDKKFKPDQPLVVFPDPSNADTLIALNAKCPHQGCAAAWKTEEKLLVCPCHQSKFKPDGSVDSGPAKEPLKPFEVKTEGDKILVKA